jgi:hypothetical protein
MALAERDRVGNAKSGQFAFGLDFERFRRLESSFERAKSLQPKKAVQRE